VRESCIPHKSESRCDLYPVLVSTDAVAVATEGLAAWRRGDFDTLERILDPNVEWIAFDPGEGDCHGRADVMRVLRERYEQGFAAGELDLSDAGPNIVIAVSHPSAIGGPEWPDETATVMSFSGGTVVSMRDYRTKAEALAAVGKQI
jgi:ketosteroid isomerase-like protein